jgi:hypothetical protein
MGLMLSLTVALAWKVLVPGIAYAKVTSGEIQAHLFRVDLKHTEVRVPFPHGGGPRRPVSAIVDDAAKVVAINASFFDESDQALGLVVDRGETLSSKRQAKWGALVVKNGRARIVAGTDVKLEDNPDAVVQGFPRLVIAGKVEHLKPQVARRTAVCADGKQLLLVVTNEAEFNAFAKFLATPESSGGAGCKDALNLDGGPSTQLEARLPGFSLAESGQPVPDALAIVPVK